MAQWKDITDTKLVLEPYQIIIRPIVTEKGFHNSSARNTYTFEVHKLASKTDIKEAIETLYDVKVVSVHTQNRHAFMEKGHDQTWRRSSSWYLLRLADTLR